MKLSDRLKTGMKKQDVEQLVSEALASQVVYAELVQFAAGAQRVQAMKAAWVLGHASAVDQTTPMRYLDQWKVILETTRVSGVQREIIKILHHCPLPPDLAGWFLDRCFALLISPNTDPASKYHSLGHILGQIKKYPELKEELAVILEGQLTWHTPAWQRYAAKRIASLRKPAKGKNQQS